MEARPLDRIHIKDLLLRCIVGIHDWERRERQDISITIVLHADLSKAAASDAIADTVDYVTIKKMIIALVERSSYGLIEALAEAIARLCLEDDRVARVDVTLEKPGALRYARTVAVEMTRFRLSSPTP
jgi:FolB domain-containing protein